MIGIRQIASFVPAFTEDNLSRCHRFDKDESFVRDKIGFLHLPRKEEGMETSDMCVAAFEALTQKLPMDGDKIDCIVVCTQNPDGHGLPHTAAIVHEKLALPQHVAAFDLSLGCSGYVYGLNMLTHFLMGNGLRTGLLFTADPYSKVLSPDDYVTELLFGDAATCTLVSDAPVLGMGHTLFGTDGTKHRAIHVDAHTRRLSMDGRGVFNFSMRIVPAHIRQCIEKNRLSVDAVDLFLLHQASKYIVDNIARRLKLPEEKVPFSSAATGNTVSSTLPLLLEQYMVRGPKTILLAGFGVGLSWASTILKRQ